LRAMPAKRTTTVIPPKKPAAAIKPIPPIPPVKPAKVGYQETLGFSLKRLGVAA
jgi:hypothetical protein